MSARTKPGFDTLVFFWLAIVLGAVGTILSVFEFQALSGGAIQSVIGVTPLGMAAIGCYVVASVFVVVTAHKIIAMLIYLVHKKP